jgi:multidrug efflux pump subunit AcrB
MATSVATPLERHLGTIAGVNEMTSTSSVGSARVTLQFDLSRNIDGAAREVQAAINASRVDLPATLRSNPTYRKANPAASPVIILALTSKTKTPGQIYDAVSNIVSQRLSQVDGVGDVEIGGGSLPAVRIELLPFALSRYGISTDDVRAAIQASNANRPKGTVQGDGRKLQIYTQTPALRASDYASMVIAWRNGAAVRLQDVAEVLDGVEDTRTLGLFNGEPAIIVLITRQPSANIIETVDSVRALLPELQAQLPPDVTLQVASDSTNSIRGSLREVEFTLVISVILVVLVVSLFLRSVRATIVPAVATVAALLGTFGVMYLLGFSLNNLSLMALTVATGFVVDDAIVVLENTSRHIESGMTRMKAALLGAKEVGFTVLSISVSLVAVFIPLLFMGGQVGRLFREFAVTLSAAVMISLVISLTTTPMMCAWLLKPGGEHDKNKPQGRLGRMAARSYDWVLKRYETSLDWALDSKGLVMLILVAVVGLNVYLFSAAPKGFFPQQDSGQLNGGLRADQSISSQALAAKLRQVVDIIRKDPAVDTVVGFTGAGRAGGGFMFVNLKPANQRTESGLAVIARLRPQLAEVTGLRVFLGTVQDVRSGGRASNSTYQYTLKSDSLADLRTWALKLSDELKQQPLLTDVDTDQDENGVETVAKVDPDSARRLGLTSTSIDNALYNAFGQRQVATIYTELNQYHVVMEWAPRYTRSPNALKRHLRAGHQDLGGGGADGDHAGGGDVDASYRHRHLVHRQVGHGIHRRRRGAGVGQPGAAQRLVGQRAEQHGHRAGAAVGGREVRGAVGRHLGEPRRRRAGHHHLVQPRRRRQPGRRARGHRQGRGQHRHAHQRARRLRGHRRQRAAVAGPAGDADRGGADRDLHRAGHPVRKPGAPDHGAVDAAVGRRGRGAGAADVPHGVLDHCADRRVPADRHREEERHPDHRLCAGGRALARAHAARSGARGLPAALSPDPDDHAGRRAGRAAAGHRLRRGRRVAPAAGRGHHRRADREPVADAADHAGGLPAARQAAPPRQERTRTEPRNAGLRTTTP